MILHFLRILIKFVESVREAVLVNDVSTVHLVRLAPFLQDAFFADPAVVDVAVAERVQELVLKTRLEDQIARTAETEDVAAFSGPVEMRSAL